MPLSDKHLANKESLIKWLIDFHNVVNKMKEKPIIKYIEARKMIDTDKQCVQPVKYIEKFTDISNIKSESCSSNNNVIYTLIGLLISLIFIAIVYKKL
jgi:hypothetical protein